eukprot:429026-Prymnesium_polylepis.1
MRVSSMLFGLVRVRPTARAISGKVWVRVGRGAVRMGRASTGRAATAGSRRAVCAGSCRLIVGAPADERGANVNRIAFTLSFTDLGAKKNGD